jgi:MoxR-like ATPase
MQNAVRNVVVKREVAEYLLRLVAATRTHPRLELGVSPRGALACFRAAQAEAFLRGRSYASPDDFQKVAIPAMAHRVQLAADARYGGETARSIVTQIVAEVRVPV